MPEVVKETQSETQTPKIRAKNVVGTTIGSTLVAIAVGFSIATLFGVLPSLWTWIAGGVLLASGGVAMGINASKINKIAKIIKTAKKSTAKKTITEESKKTLKKEEEQQDLFSETLQEQSQSVQERQRVVQKKSETVPQSTKDDVMEQYQLKDGTHIHNRSFTIYEKDGKTVKKDAHGDDMCYAISGDSNYMSKVIEFVVGQGSQDCVFGVVDANGTQTLTSIGKTEYALKLGGVLQRIGAISKTASASKAQESLVVPVITDTKKDGEEMSK